MAILKNSFETGVDPDTLFVAGSSGGNAGNALTLTTDTLNTITYATPASRGFLAARLAMTAGKQSYFQWSVADYAIGSSRMYVKWQNFGANYAAFMAVRNNANVEIFSIGINNASGQVRSYSNQVSHGPSMWGGSYPTLATDIWYRVEAIVYKGTTTTDGRVQAKIFALHGTTPLAALDTGTAVDTKTAGSKHFRYGRTSPVADLTDQVMWVDDVAASDSGTWIGPSDIDNIVPTITPSSARVDLMTGQQGTFSWVENDPDGFIINRSVTRLSGPGAAPSLEAETTTSRTSTWANSGVHKYRVTIVDEAGGTSFTDIFVHVSSPYAYIADAPSNPGLFTATGGTIPAVLNDSDPATFMASPDAPANNAIRLTVSPVGAGVITVKLNSLDSGQGGTIEQKVELLQGSTVISTWTDNLTSTATDYTYTTTVPEAAAITDRSALSLRITHRVV